VIGRKRLEIRVCKTEIRAPVWTLSLQSAPPRPFALAAEQRSPPSRRRHFPRLMRAVAQGRFPHNLAPQVRAAAQGSFARPALVPLCFLLRRLPALWAPPKAHSANHACKPVLRHSIDHAVACVASLGAVSQCRTKHERFDVFVNGSAHPLRAAVLGRLSGLGGAWHAHRTPSRFARLARENVKILPVCAKANC